MRVLHLPNYDGVAKEFRTRIFCGLLAAGGTLKDAKKLKWNTFDRGRRGAIDVPRAARFRILGDEIRAEYFGAHGGATESGKFAQRCSKPMVCSAMGTKIFRSDSSPGFRNRAALGTFNCATPAAVECIPLQFFGRPQLFPPAASSPQKYPCPAFLGNPS